ncbi:MAG: magnesium chelatase subunit H [Methanosaeta sp. PtaB.Bin039]|nr:MAG: magnesium chelatase subunit H [Methanosaeta sp. PtaB.Bin039]
MKKIEIAYISTTGLDVFPIISAPKELKTKKGDVAEVILRYKDDLSDPKTMDDFMSFAVGSDLAIQSPHGGKAILGSFDEITLRLKGANVPLYAQDTSKLYPATAEVLEDWMYEELASKYALDEKMQEWLADMNPHALLNISERLLKGNRPEYVGCNRRDEERLRDVYLEFEGMIEDDST